MKTLRLILAAALLATLIVLGSSSKTSRSGKEPAGAFNPTSRINAAQVEMDDLRAAYLKENKACAMGTEERIKKIVDAAERDLRDTAVQAAKPFQGFANLSKCVARGAKDTITGGDSLAQYTGKAMAPCVTLISRTHAELQGVIDAHHHQTSGLYNRFQRDTLAVLERHDLSRNEIPFPNLEELIVPPEDAVLASQDAALSVTMEVALVTTTYSMIKKALGHLIARQAASLSAGGVAAISDGPFPVGDVIGAGIAVIGTGWTAWDLRKAVKKQKHLPSDIATTLQQQLDSLCEEALDYTHSSSKATEKQLSSLSASQLATVK